MRTVTETALATDLEDLREEMAYFLPLKINRTETLDARRVDHRTLIEKIHLTERGGVHAFVVGIRDLTGTRHLASEERIE